MIIAIPTSNKQICKHFGHCDHFALIDIDEATQSIRSLHYKEPPPHEPGRLPTWLNEQGVNVVIANGIGQGAKNIFSQIGIKVVVGAIGNTPEGLVAAYFDQTLTTEENSCDHSSSQSECTHPAPTQAS